MKIFISTALAALILVTTLFITPLAPEPARTTEQETAEKVELLPVETPTTTKAFDFPTAPATSTTTLSATEPKTTEKTTTTRDTATTTKTAAKPTTAKATTRAETTTEGKSKATTAATSSSTVTHGKLIGEFRITGYTDEEGFKYGAKTASGMKCRPGICAMGNSRRKELGIKYGDEIYVEGRGTFIVADCGCKYDSIDIWCYTNAEARKLTGYANVYYVPERETSQKGGFFLEKMLE